MSSLGDSYLLHKFLFHLRTPLSGIRGASLLAKQMHEKLPKSLFTWLEKWRPAVEKWLSAEVTAHSYFRDGEAHDWKEIIYEMAENMKDVSVAYIEGQDLEVPESPEGKMIVRLALDGGFKYLNGIIQPILNRDFQHLLNM